VPPATIALADFDSVDREIGCANADVGTDDILVTESGLYLISYNLIWDNNGEEAEAVATLLFDGAIRPPPINLAVSNVNVPVDTAANANGTAINCLPAGTRVSLLFAQNSESPRDAFAIFLSVTRLECVDCPPLPPPVAL
jgi:hypothetical protein